MSLIPGRARSGPRDRPLSEGNVGALTALRSSQDQRSTGSASTTPGPVSPGQRAYRSDQPDSRLSFGARHHRVRQGLRFLRQVLPEILAKRTDVLSPRIVRIVADLAGDWRQLDERIEVVTDEIETLAKSDDSCRRVMTVPGIGPIISSAMVAAIGSGAVFARGRDFSAWIGLVPKQMSTGDRTILGRISKRGNGYLRMLFMQAARVILLTAGELAEARLRGLARSRRSAPAS